jgi:glycosyltransferase involved in cell wall biosynthesis
LSAANGPTAGDTPDILFLIGCWLGESKRYRVYNLAAALEARGYHCLVHDFFRVRDIMALGIVPRVAVFFRAPYDPNAGVVEAVDYFRWNQVLTVFDVDDYVFEPELVSSIAAIAHYSQSEQFAYRWGVRAYRSMMFCCDITTASTDFLAARMRDLGRQSATIINSLNPEQIELAEKLVKEPFLQRDTVRIGYYSGSNTHQRDFLICATALQETMRRHPEVHLRLVGLLDLDETWLPFADRIDRSGFMEPLRMLADVRGCDINLAPLEEGNPFCEGKSELKFFEAAVVGVPTLASRTAPFRAAIEDGVNGFLATGPEEWQAHLERLVSSPELRRAVGDAARTTALERFSPDVAARMALDAYGLESWAESAPRSPRNTHPTIGWILPNIIIGGGGHRNILRAAYHLEQFGYDVRIYVHETKLSAASLRQQVRRHFYPFAGPVRPFTGAVDGEDVLMATHWSTVALAESVSHDVGQIMYFVQDFEPAFYPMGSDYIKAENTYRKGLYAICSGPWCSRILRSRYGMEADFFRFPIDREIYHAKVGDTRLNRIVFFAKPEMPRRCFAIGVDVLRIVNRLRPDIEIVFFGSTSAEARDIDFPVTHAMVLPTLSDLAKLYASAKIGMAFSTTNPSLVPYEMMACGTPVVDMDLPDAEVNYGESKDIALLAGPAPDDMAEQIIALIDDEAEWSLRSKAGLEFVAELPTEEEMARRIETLMLRRLQQAPNENELTPLALGAGQS